MNKKAFIPTCVEFSNNDSVINIALSVKDFIGALEDSPSSRKVGRPRLLTPEEEQLVNALVQSGVQVEGIAEAFGISRATLYRYQKQKNLKNNNQQ